MDIPGTVLMRVSFTFAIDIDRDLPDPEPVPRGDNYASTELAHPEPESTLNRSGFSVEPYP